jgi:hypothetical protein
MSGTTTPNYGFSLPAIGGNQDSWGNLLNANWTTADNAIHGLSSGYLKLSGGGSITGNLGVSGVVTAGNFSTAGNLSAASVTTTAGIAAGAYLSSVAGVSCGSGLSIATQQVSDFDIYRIAPNRVLQWSSGVNIAYSETDGGVTWNTLSIQQMKLDAAGNLTVHGTVYGTNVLLAGGLDVGDILRDLLQRVADLEALCLA